MHPLEQFKSIPEAFFARCSAQPQAQIYTQAFERGGTRVWEGRSCGEVEKRVLALAGFLNSLGVKQGDKIAILSSSRPEWMEADLAVLCLGGVVVSIYPSLSAHEVGYILYDSQSSMVFAENEEQIQKLLELNSKSCPIPACESREAHNAQLKIKNIIAFDAVEPNQLTVQFVDCIKSERAFSKTNIAALNRSDLANLVYTSGTTGPPKGVMQSHGNHLANARQVLTSGLVSEETSIFVFLPLAHSFAKLMGYLGFVSACTLKFPLIPNPKSSKMDPDSVTRDIREGSANVVPIVPRILEKMQAGVQKRAHGWAPKALALKLTLWAAKQVQEKRNSLLADMIYQGTEAIRSAIKQALFGPNFSYVVSGGAKLGPEVCKFFDALGIEILEGYGLTETCVATNANRRGKKKIGTVGPLLADDIEIKIASDDEILYRGPNITSAYFRREQASKASWDSEGWFHTGDLGAIDKDGYLSIIGRKKELLVSSYGKKISPEAIEEQIKSCPYISQAVMVGDNRAFCTALITLEASVLREWAKKRGIAFDAELASNSEVNSLIKSHLDQVNAGLASFEQIKKFRILNADFSVENGLLTPTFKVKRREVTKRFANEIEGLYLEN